MKKPDRVEKIKTIQRTIDVVMIHKPCHYDNCDGELIASRLDYYLHRCNKCNTFVNLHNHYPFTQEIITNTYILVNDSE